MGSFSIWHWLIVAVIILLLFGKGRISDVMGDLGKGIKSFKKGVTEEETEQRAAPRLESTPAPAPAAPREERSSTPTGE